MNRSNLPLPDSKAAANRAIVTKRKSASARNRAAAANRVAGENKAAANKEAASKADDKLCRELTKRREATPAVFLVRLPPPKFSVSSGAQENVGERSPRFRPLNFFASRLVTPKPWA